MKEDNLKFWESVEKTDPSHTKKVSGGGYKFTAIDAYHQIKNATDLWGAYGKKWGFYDTRIEVINVGEDTIALFGGTFKSPEGEFPLSTSMPVRYKTSKDYFKLDGDFAKKMETDAITKALSRLGFNADVFLGRFDDNRYVDEMKAEFSGEGEQKKVVGEVKKEFPGAKVVSNGSVDEHVGLLKTFTTKSEFQDWKAGTGDKLSPEIKGPIMTEYFKLSKEAK